jgi:hypothetical protein
VDQNHPPEPGGSAYRHSSPAAEPSGKTLAVLLGLDLLLMVFSVVLWQLNNDTLAATAGAGAIALAVDIARRLLTPAPVAAAPAVQSKPAGGEQQDQLGPGRTG